jgi:flagellar FliJ protein
MKRFRFPLQPVVVLRTHRESRAREAFAAAVHGYVQSEEKLQVARQRVADLEAALFAGRSGSFSAAEETHNLHGYHRETEAEMAAERAMIAARDLMGRRRAEYIEAHRQLEVVNRLEVKARTAHRTATNREEQAEFDDFATRRAFRREVVVSS